MAFTTVNKSTNFYNTKLYTGTGSSLALTGVGFEPDLVWVKNRSSSGEQSVFDQVRGVNKRIRPNTDGAETTAANSVTSFDSDGFTVVSHADTNTNGDNFVSFNWNAGTTSGLSGGTITPSAYSINTTSKFGIYKYSGTGSNGTIAHGLGATPTFMIFKKTTGSQGWHVYHKGMGATHEIYMNSTAVQNDVDTAFNDTAPTDTVFTIGTSNGMNSSGEDYIAYVYCNVVGYQKAGTFEGNGNAFPNSPFIYLGFKPKLFLWKNIDAGNSDDNWNMINAEAQEYNAQDKGYLMANSNGAETGYSGNSINFLSNGVKLNVSSAYHNSSGETYIYYAVGQTIVGTNNIPATAR